LALGLSAAFEELGFKLHVVLGAAGILSVAVGFAAQTTLSNLISGFFLFGERPFGVGDTIEVEGVAGEVLGVEMLATTLRTADNRFVRIPNEVLVKTKLTNQTRFPRRRLELVIPLANDEDFSKSRTTILEVVKKNPLCLPDPGASIFIGEFGETSVQAHVWAWVETKDLQVVRAALSEEIHAALDTWRGAPPPAAWGLPMKIRMHRLSLHQLPVDLFADPDGTWSYESLVAAAGFDPDAVPAPLVGALREPWCGHPEGAAVVAGASENDSIVAIVECVDSELVARALDRAA